MASSKSMGWCVLVPLDLLDFAHDSCFQSRHIYAPLIRFQGGSARTAFARRTQLRVPTLDVCGLQSEVSGSGTCCRAAASHMARPAGVVSFEKDSCPYPHLRVEGDWQVRHVAQFQREVALPARIDVIPPLEWMSSPMRPSELLPSRRATRSSGTSTCSSVLASTNSPGCSMKGRSSQAISISVMSLMSCRTSMNGRRELRNTRMCLSSLTSYARGLHAAVTPAATLLSCRPRGTR